jgi:acyl-CoA thioester hydrolase
MEEVIFKYKMKVRDYELDGKGVVNSANYQRYFEITRHEFLENNGVSFVDLHNEGIDAIVSSIKIDFKDNLKCSDEFYCTLNTIQKKGIRYFFDQKIIEISDQKVCAEARVEIVCSSEGKPIRPDIFDKLFGNYLVAP